MKKKQPYVYTIWVTAAGLRASLVRALIHMAKCTFFAISYIEKKGFISSPRRWNASVYIYKRLSCLFWCVSLNLWLCPLSDVGLSHHSSQRGSTEWLSENEERAKDREKEREWNEATLNMYLFLWHSYQKFGDGERYAFLFCLYQFECHRDLESSLEVLCPSFFYFITSRN